MAKQERFTVELTEKERYSLWVIATFFKSPITSTLKGKLWPGDAIRKKYDEKGLGDLLEARVIDFGVWLKEFYAKNESK